MPYISNERRAKLYPKLDDYMQSPGELNYVLTQVVLKYLRQPRKEQSYTNYNEVMGVLACMQQELYRREISGYENLKMLENGDVY